MPTLSTQTNRHRKLHVRERAPAQALVELALASTLIFFLLAAAIDLGLMFFTYQGLRVAAQEGAAFGSYPKIDKPANGAVTVDLNYAEIVNRVRYSAGTSGKGFANLLDLNSNGKDDSQEAAVINPKGTAPTSYIIVRPLKDVNDNDKVNDDGDARCTNTIPKVDLRSAANNCYIAVTVRYTYRFIFPFAPVFGNEYTLETTSTIAIRSSFTG